eukprot:COSAG02_NODE_939_length_15774_cov_4.701180_3_plen_56_part_00
MACVFGFKKLHLLSPQLRLIPSADVLDGMMMNARLFQKLCLDKKATCLRKRALRQ